MVSRSAFRLTGLLMYSVAPAWRQRSWSPGMARAVRAMSGVEVKRGSARRRRVASRPSMPGIWMDIQIHRLVLKDLFFEKPLPGCFDILKQSHILHSVFRDGFI